MPNRRSLAATLAVLALGAGDAGAQHVDMIDVLSYSWGASQATATSVDGNRSITIHGHRTEDVGAAPDRDAQLKGQKILQNAPAARMTAAPGTQDAYLQYRLKPAIVTSYSMSGDAGMQPEGEKVLRNAMPPTNPSPAGVLKLDGVDPKAAIAINTPLRTLPSRSAADGSSATLINKFQALPHQAPGLGASVGRR